MDSPPIYMRFSKGSLTALICLTSLTAWSRPEHNAFLNKSVFTTSQLVHQVQSDPIVLHRYEKHFKMSEPTLIHYFQGLHLEPLKVEKRYLVFNVDDSFVIGHRLLHLKPGTLVFADSSHKPILKRSCGNPMTDYLPALGENTKGAHSGGSAGEVSERKSGESSDLLALAGDSGATLSGSEPSMPVETLAANDSGTTTTGSILSSMNSQTQLEAVESVGSAGQSVGDIAGAGAIGAGLAGLLGAAGTVVALTHTSGGGTRGGGPPAVPEPTPILAVGLGVGLMGLYRRRTGR